MNIAKKAKEFFFPKINKAMLKEATRILNIHEKKIFDSMMDYDILHSLEVYKKLKKTKLKDNTLYLKLALLHDCGKGRVGFTKRVAHKFGLPTKLSEHPENGFEIMKDYDRDLAVLIRMHHTPNYSENMDIFQKCDDLS